MKRPIDYDPDLRGKRDLVLSIDGIADKTAALILAEMGDIGRLTYARAVTAFAGLDPRLQESGTFHGHTRISRTGSARLRTALYLPATVVLTHNPAIKAQAERLKARGKKGKETVCAAMRKLPSNAYGVLKSGKPCDAALAITH